MTRLASADSVRDSASFDDARGAGLPPAAAQRVSNQVGRAFRGTYGAKTGLRSLVRGLAAPMLASGTLPETVIQAFQKIVLEHPARVVGDPRNVVTGVLQSDMLMEVIRDCVSAVDQQ